MRRKQAIQDPPNADLLPVKVPRHVAIIMDGNNRWARKRHLPGAAGHKAGLESVRTVMQCCADSGVEILTLFAFSSENWRRPEDEVSSLMSLFLSALKREVAKLNDNGIRVRIIGNRQRFSAAIQEHMQEAEQLTAGNDRCTVVIAADYGGQWDIAQAARQLAEAAVAGDIKPADISPELVQQRICIGEMPAPDLCIRTGGEHRISNFLLWQMAYTELYFTDVYWPDFGKDEFAAALHEYGQRERRFGHTSNKS